VVPFGVDSMVRVTDVLRTEESARATELAEGRRVGRLSLGDRLVMAAALSMNRTPVTTDQFMVDIARRLAPPVLDHHEDTSEPVDSEN